MEYFVTESLREAERLKEKSGRYFYLAGGTILNWKGSPKARGLIDLKNLSLSEITVTKSKVVLGATATIQDIVENSMLPGALVEAAKNFTSRNVRNIATVGGTTSGTFFVSNLMPVFLAFKADIEYYYKGKKRQLPLIEWLNSRPGLICRVIITELKRKVKVQQEKIAAIDFPLIVTSIGFKIVNKTIVEAVVAISGSAAKTLVINSASGYLNKRKISDVDYDKLNLIIQKEIKPIKNVRVSAEVKRRFIQNHIKSIISEFKGDVK